MSQKIGNSPKTTISGISEFDDLGYLGYSGLVGSLGGEVLGLGLGGEGGVHGEHPGQLVLQQGQPGGRLGIYLILGFV